MLSVEVGSMTTDHLNLIVLSLGTYYFAVDVLSDLKFVMRRVMINPREVKVRRYSACLIGLNEYLAAFHGSNASGENVRRNWMKKN